MILAHWPFYNVIHKTGSRLHDKLHYCHSRTEPRPQVTCIENLVKFERAVFEVSERRDRQTDRGHTDTLITILSGAK